MPTNARVLSGCRIAQASPTAPLAYVSGVADSEQGLASGVLNTSLQIGGAVILAIITAIPGDQGSISHNQLLPHMHTALAVVIGVSAGAVLLTVVHVLRTPVATKPVAVAPVTSLEPAYEELEAEAA